MAKTMRSINPLWDWFSSVENLFFLPTPQIRLGCEVAKSRGKISYLPPIWVAIKYLSWVGVSLFFFPQSYPNSVLGLNLAIDNLNCTRYDSSWTMIFSMDGVSSRADATRSSRRSRAREMENSVSISEFSENCWFDIQESHPPMKHLKKKTKNPPFPQCF